jgi:ABC-2 type transport system permease protein
MENKNNASIKHGSYSMLMVVLVLAFLVAANILVQKLPTGMTAYDMSDIKLYSISDKTKEVVRSLDEDVTIYLIGETGEQDQIISQMLALYDDLSSKLHVKELDKNGGFATLKKYGLANETIDNGSILVTSEARMKYIPASDVYDLDYAKYFQSQTEIYNYDGEGEVTSALLYVTAKDIPKICRVIGHEELALGDTIQSVIKKASYELTELNLATASIPEDCDILLINAPSRDYTVDEANKIRDYMDRGGKVFIDCAYENYETETFKSLLEYCGIELKKGVVFEQADHCQNPEAPFAYFANVSSSAAITKEMSQNTYAFVYLSTGLYTSEMKKNTLKLTPFLQTTSGAFQRVDYETNDKVSKTDTDLSGPITIGLTGEDSASGMKMVVLGTPNLAAQNVLGAFPNSLNMDIYIASLNYLCAFDRGVSIPAKSTDFGQNIYMASTRNLALVLTVGVLPIVVLLIGFIVWYKRRNR